MGVEVNDARQEWRSDGMPFTGFEGSPESVADAALAQRELGPAGHDYKRCATDAAEGEDTDLTLVMTFEKYSIVLLFLETYCLTILIHLI